MGGREGRWGGREKFREWVAGSEGERGVFCAVSRAFFCAVPRAFFCAGLRIVRTCAFRIRFRPTGRPADGLMAAGIKPSAFRQLHRTFKADAQGGRASACARQSLSVPERTPALPGILDKNSHKN